MTTAAVTEIELNGVAYVRKDQAQAAPIPGKRAVIVVDRGWIFAGDVTEENGRIQLTRAVWVFGWESIGFDGMIADPKNSKVKLRPMANVVDVPDDSEIFRTRVGDSWGL